MWTWPAAVYLRELLLHEQLLFSFGCYKIRISNWLGRDTYMTGRLLDVVVVMMVHLL